MCHYKRLAAEMFVNGITKNDLAKLLGKSIHSINNIFDGKSDFTFEEVELIMDSYFISKEVDAIFIK